MHLSLGSSASCVPGVLYVPFPSFCCLSLPPRLQGQAVRVPGAWLEDWCWVKHGFLSAGYLLSKVQLGQHYGSGFNRYPGFQAFESEPRSLEPLSVDDNGLPV